MANEKMAPERHVESSRSAMGNLSLFDLFVCDVLLAITDGETDDIAKFPMGTQDRLETLYTDLTAAVPPVLEAAAQAAGYTERQWNDLTPAHREVIRQRHLLGWWRDEGKEKLRLLSLRPMDHQGEAIH